jgi:hypothetical protein
MSVFSPVVKRSFAVALTFATVAITSLIVNSPARAWRGDGAAVGAGIAGGLVAGALIGSAVRPGYNGYTYGEGPVCHFERRRIQLDDGSVRVARVRICEAE